MSVVTLGGLKSGINRLREKGGASKDVLFDLVNGYVDASGSVRARPGTGVAYTLPAGTAGLCAFNGKLQVFAAAAVANMPADVVLNILRHPDPSFTGTIAEIHFAKPFKGALYVVAEFSDGNVYHYWLNQADAWAADKIYFDGDMVQPTAGNVGFVFTPTPSVQPDAWQSDVKRAVGDVVVPTVANGFKYTVTEVTGDNPVSGDVEPDWIASDGAIVYEDVNATVPSDTSSGSTGGDTGTTDPKYGGSIAGGGVGGRTVLQ